MTSIIAADNLIKSKITISTYVVLGFLYLKKCNRNIQQKCRENFVHAVGILSLTLSGVYVTSKNKTEINSNQIAVNLQHYSLQLQIYVGNTTADKARIEAHVP